jgi:tetratricopeptide (TPR) repeat protein
MYELNSIPASKIEKFSSILVLNIIDNTTLADSSEKRSSFSQKIEQVISQYDGKIINLLNSEIIITFSTNNTSEKHALRAYRCYQAISNIVERYNLSAKAFINSANICIDGAICWDSTPQTTRDLLFSATYPKDKKILFSESAVQLLENELNFDVVYKRNKNQKLKFYSLTNSKIQLSNFRFIGRRIEHELIQKSLPENNHVCICGPAGIGKTSLVEHYLEDSDYFIIRCSFYKNAYEGLYRQLFDELLNLLNMPRLDSENEKFKALKSLAHPTAEEEEFLYKLYEDPYLHKNHCHLGVDLLVKCVEQIAPHKNICLYFDDIQWAAEEFEDFCSAINNPIVRIISTSRTLPKNKEKCVVVNLKPLQRHDIKDIVQELIPYDMITKDLIENMFQQTSGNPYYLKEMIKSFLRRQGKAPMSKKDLSAHEPLNNLPLSLKNLIKHQIDILPEELKEILQICSCIGQKFNIPLIQNVCGIEDFNARQILHALCDADFLKFSMRTTSYEFIHSLKEKSVYENIPRIKRIAIHRKIADSLQNQKNIVIRPILSQQLFNAEMWRSAYRENLKDARLYIKNLEPRLAMEAITRCMTSATKMHALKKVRSTRLRLMLNTVYFILGEIKSAQKFITPINDLFSNKELLKYPEIWNAALNELTFFYWISAEYDLTLKIIDQAETEFSSILNSATAGALIIRRIGVYSDIGQLEKSNKLINALLSPAQQDDFADWPSIFPVRPVLYALKCRNHAYMKHFAQFEENAFKALKLSAAQTAPSTQIFTLCYVADGYIQFKNFNKAIQLLNQAITLMNASHIYVLRSYIMSLMGYCDAVNGMYIGFSKISNAIYSAQINGRSCRLPLFYFYIAKALHHLGDKAAKRYLVKGFKLAKSQKEEWVIHQIFSFANNMRIQIEKPKNPSQNIINFSEHISRKASGG